MSTVNQVYLKDENDNIVSPVTSVNSIYDSTGGGIESYIVDLIYPVGSIYISANTTSPATLFGGTWEQIQDKFLLSSGDTYTSGDTGGEAEHTLTTSEMPKHSHTMFSYLINGSSTGGGYNLPTSTAATSAGTSTGYMGGSEAHNNMPPYLVVNVWKRTA